MSDGDNQPHMGRLRMTPIRVALLVGVVALVANVNGLANGFAYDDSHLVVANEGIQSLKTLPTALLAPYWSSDSAGIQGLWRPATTALMGIEHALWGLRPAPWHAVNILLHGAASALVVLLLVELMPLLAALLAGLVFAVHPVHVEAVANIVGVAELLAAVPYLAACVITLRGGGTRRILLASLLYALAFLAKESAVTLPAAIVLLDAARRSIPLRDLGSYLRRRGPLLGALAFTAILLLAARVPVLEGGMNPEPPLGADILRQIPRIWTLGVIWSHYPRLLLAPFQLSADYTPDLIPILTVWTPSAIAGVITVVGLLFVALRCWGEPELSPSRLSLRLAGFGVVWFLITISPVSNVFFLTGVLLAERTLYLPSVGPIAAVGAGLALFVRVRPRAGWVMTAAVFSLLALRGWTRTPVWQDSSTLFTNLINEQPASGRSQWALGDALRDQGRPAEAYYRAYARAIGRLNGSYRLLTDVGRQAEEDGRTRLAEHLFLRAWEERPELARAQQALALLYQREGRPEEVARFARETLRLLPADVGSWHLLAGALASLGQWDEAVFARKNVIQFGEGDHWQQWLSLANLSLAAGDASGAEAALDSALARADAEEVRREIIEAFAPPSVSGGG